MKHQGAFTDMQISNSVDSRSATSVTMLSVGWFSMKVSLGFSDS